MKKILLLICCMSAFMANAQNKGQINLGVKVGAGFGGVQGFIGQYGVNVGKVVGKNLVIGVNSNFQHNTWPTNRLEVILGGGEVKKYTSSVYHVGFFAKQYIGDKAFKPFVQVGLGLNGYHQYFTESGQRGAKNNEIKPEINVGVGAAYFFGKKKNMALEAAFLLSNRNKLNYIGSTQDGKFYKANSKGGGVEGHVNLGLQFYLK